jgi:Flp pilus assembly pilin Flp
MKLQRAARGQKIFSPFSYRRFFKDRSGAAAVEYACIASMVTLAIYGALELTGQTIEAKFNNVQTAIAEDAGLSGSGAGTGSGSSGGGEPSGGGSSSGSSGTSSGGSSGSAGAPSAPQDKKDKKKKSKNK